MDMNKYCVESKISRTGILLKLFVFFILFSSTTSLWANAMGCVSNNGLCTPNPMDPSGGCKIDVGGICNVTAWNQTSGVWECRLITNSGGAGPMFVPGKFATDNWYRYVTSGVSAMQVGGAGSCTQSTLDCPANGSQAWSAGSPVRNCVAGLPLGSYNDTQVATDSTPPETGSGSFKCLNGAWTVQGTPTCVGASCTGAPQSWGGGCTGNTSTVADNATSATSSSGSFTGNATYLCNNGSFVLQAGSTCSGTAPCNGAYLGWGSCGANFATAANGGSSNGTNDVAGYTGTATQTCSNGTWTVGANTCTPNGCGSQAFSWGGSCSGSVSPTGSGSTATATNTVGGFTGSAVYTCTTGNWSGPSSPTCTSTVTCPAGTSVAGTGGPATGGCNCNVTGETWCATTLACEAAGPIGCASQAMSWVVGANTCNSDSNIASVASGSTSNANDTVAPTTGSAVYSCTNGTWSVSGTPTCSTGPSFTLSYTDACHTQSSYTKVWTWSGPTTCTVTDYSGNATTTATSITITKTYCNINSIHVGIQCYGGTPSFTMPSSSGTGASCGPCP
jgi:hypothetical protein